MIHGGLRGGVGAQHTAVAAPRAAGAADMRGVGRGMLDDRSRPFGVRPVDGHVALARLNVGPVRGQTATGALMCGWAW
ncbi:MAG: hypothetical protein O9972_29775 [Burkholderiales bacterium]|nr:hypothetical protein [Burkholderiales bacterium]